MRIYWCVTLCARWGSHCKAEEGRQRMGSDSIKSLRGVSVQMGDLLWSGDGEPEAASTGNYNFIPQSTESALAIIYVTSSQAHPHLWSFAGSHWLSEKEISKKLHNMCFTFADTLPGTTNFSKKSNFSIKGLILLHSLATCRLSKRGLFLKN